MMHEDSQKGPSVVLPAWASHEVQAHVVLSRLVGCQYVDL